MVPIVITIYTYKDLIWFIFLVVLSDCQKLLILCNALSTSFSSDDMEQGSS